jgi:DNA-binding transcriptional MerR regulator
MNGSGKLYYGIKEVADMVGINMSKVRYYEKKFPSFSPKVNPDSGERSYTLANIDHLREILDLVDNQGMTLQGAQKYLENRNVRRRENARVTAKLVEIKDFLQQLRDSLDEQPQPENQPVEPS